MLTLESRQTDISNKINGMTHKQLCRFARHIGLRGDFMKGENGLTATEHLKARIHNALALVSKDESGISHIESQIVAAFPGGLYIKGQRRHSAAPYSPGMPATVTPYQTNPAPSASPEPVQASPAPAAPDDTAAQIGAAIASVLASRPTGISESRVLELIATHAPKPETGVYRIEVKYPDKPALISGEQPRHEVFPELVHWLSLGKNVLLVGPAGSGKTHIASQACEALSLAFGFTGAVNSKYDLLGYNDAQGRYVATEYYRRYSEGGGFLGDEFDGWSPNATLAMNAGLANGHQDFPCGVTKRHADFRMIASANTYGNGANRQYVGRNQMDSASLDRFVVLPMDYDEKLERNLFGDNEWVSFVHTARRAVASLSVRHVVSMRAIADGLAGLSVGLSREVVESRVLWKGLDKADIAKIRAAM